MTREASRVIQITKNGWIGPANPAYADVARQTRLESLIEAGINIVIGFAINFIANWFFLPMIYGHPVTFKDNMVLGLAFTVVSVARQYAIRRWAQDSLREFKVRVASAITRRFA